MRARQWLAGALLAGAVALMAVGGAGAASITLTPSTVNYSGQPTLKATGLTPGATYVVQIYDPFGLPTIPGPFFTLTAGADGTATTTDVTPDQTNLPGTYLFELQTQDGKLVARATGTLTGTNTYYRQHRLGS